MTTVELSLIKSHPKFITQEIRLSNVRLSAGRVINLPPTRNLNDFHHMLTFKNRKLHEKRRENHVRQNPERYMNGRYVGDVNILVEQEKQRSRMARYDTRNQLTDFQSDKRSNKLNTNELYLVNQYLKQEVKKSQIFVPSHVNRDRVLTSKLLTIDYDESIKLHSSKITKLSINSKQKNNENKNLQQVPWQKMDNSQNRFTKQKKISDYMDQKILQYFSGSIGRKQTITKIDFSTARLDCTNKQRIFGIFMKILFEKVEKAKEKGLNFFDYYHQRDMDAYYEFRMKTEEKWQRFVLHKLPNERRLIEMVENQFNPTNQPKKDSDIHLFCKCVMLLLTGTAGKKDLIALLKANPPHDHFVDGVQDLFKCEEPCYSQQYIQKNINVHLYGTNVYYRLFTKILYNPQNLEEEEIKNLNQKEQKFLTYILLRYKPSYHRSSVYKTEKSARFLQLTEQLKVGIKSRIEPIIQRMIELVEFDQIYINIFNKERNSNSPLQNLFLLDIFFFEKDLIVHSEYKEEDLVEKMIEYLILVVDKTNDSNCEKICKFMVEVLKKYRPIIGEKHSTLTGLYLIKQKPVLISSKENIMLVQRQLQFSWDDIEQTLLNQKYTREEYRKAIDKCLGEYIDYQNPIYKDYQDSIYKLSPKSDQTQKSSRRAQQVVILQRNSTNQSWKFNLKLENFLNQNPQETIVNHIHFSIGIKLLIKYFIKFFTTYVHTLSEEQSQETYCYFHLTLKKVDGIRKDIISMIAHVNREKQIQMQIVDHSLQAIGNLYEIGQFFLHFYRIKKVIHQKTNQQFRILQDSYFSAEKTFSLNKKAERDTKLKNIFYNMKKQGIFDREFGQKQFMIEFDDWMNKMKPKFEKVLRQRAPDQLNDRSLYLETYLFAQKCHSLLKQIVEEQLKVNATNSNRT